MSGGRLTTTSGKKDKQRDYKTGEESTEGSVNTAITKDINAFPQSKPISTIK